MAGERAKNGTEAWRTGRSPARWSPGPRTGRLATSWLLAGTVLCHLILIGPVVSQTSQPAPATASAEAASGPVTTQAAGTQPGSTQSAGVAATQEAETQPAATQATSQPGAVASRPAVPTTMYDTTLAPPILPRDFWERISLERGFDYQLVDRLLDSRTRPPAFDRKPPGTLPADAVIAEGVPMLPDTNPFPEPVTLPPKEPSIHLGASVSTYHTREKKEVLAALQPLIDLVQREVNVKAAVVLYDNPQRIFFGLRSGSEQMVISSVFDYLLLRVWLAREPENGVIPLAWAQPANPFMGETDRNLPGIPGTSVELIVARDSPYKTFADLRGKRLALTANYTHAPGTFLTQLLVEAGHPLDQPFFGKVTLRRYSKDPVIDVYKGVADVACVDAGTVGTLYDFYGLEHELRTLAVSPRYNVDVLYTSANNLPDYRTEIELTQTQITTLGKNAEGQEVLYLFDTMEWHVYRDGDFAVPEQYFGYFVTFLGRTPVDLKPLLDPAAPVDRRTYDRYGDE